MFKTYEIRPYKEQINAEKKKKKKLKVTREMNPPLSEKETIKTVVLMSATCIGRHQENKMDR